jgi:uncharacterized membrane protein
MVSMATPILPAKTHHPVANGNQGDNVNLNAIERWVSLGGGTLATLYGLRNRSLVLTAVGAALLYRGASGHCSVYGALGINTRTPANSASRIPSSAGVRVVRAITVNRPAAELFQQWRNLADLPRFISHLVSVTETDKTSRWVARGPAGSTVTWNAELINENPDRLIAWRSLPGSLVATAGSVRFQPAPGNRGTEVVVTLKYDPPTGKLGSWLAWLFGEEPGLQIRADLRRFKQFMEAAEFPTVEGQPSCRAGHS